jgi:hypothetical protein
MIIRTGTGTITAIGAIGARMMRTRSPMPN